jgi:hypothetical protein|tara:strand:- start:361 stop:624 length:264 start_codon:yes stop_codon:yes gene_type:complete
MKVDNTADISDQLNVMVQMMETIDPEDPEVQAVADNVINASVQMLQVGMSIRLLSLVGESFLTDTEEEIISVFIEWASDITDALESL